MAPRKKANMNTTPSISSRLVRICLGVLVLLGPPAIVTVACQSRSEAKPEPEGRAAAPGVMGVTRKSDGRATVELTPKDYAQGKLTVEIRVNTHTVDDLDKYDLSELTTLEWTGKAVHPTSAPKLRGHHNTGALVFPVTPLPNAFSIIIRGLDEPAVRTFTWP